jgi:hypothetical protein
MNIVSPILCLRLIKNPLAIIALIVAIIVYSINAMKLAWPFPNIGYKCIKRITPTFRHNYPTAAISWVTFFIHVVTSSFYSAPYLVLYGIREAMCFIEHSCSFLEKASARLCRSGSKMFASNYGSNPARANAIPKRYFCSLPLCLRNDRKKSKNMASKVNEIMCAHAGIILANGTTWDPGSGKGIYIHNGTVWTRIVAIP